MRRHQNRLGELGSAFHVFARGLDRKTLFRDERDRNAFLLMLREILRATETRCYAFALMGNHYHLLLRTVATPISPVLHRLNLRYALYFNRRHDGAGHVFQGRFRSVLIEDEAHLGTALVYVHLNPVTAGLVSDEMSLRAHRWTAHAALMGCIPHDFVDVDSVLPIFGDDRKGARSALARAMRARIATEPEQDEHIPFRLENALAFRRRDADDLAARNVAGVLGESRRIHTLLEQRDRRAWTRARLRADGWDAPTLLDVVCGVLRVSSHRVRAGGKTGAQSRARALFCHLAAEYLGSSRSELARCCGVSTAGATYAGRIGRRLARIDGLGATDVFGADWIALGDLVEAGTSRLKPGPRERSRG